MNVPAGLRFIGRTKCMGFIKFFTSEIPTWKLSLYFYLEAVVQPCNHFCFSVFFQYEWVDALM